MSYTPSQKKRKIEASDDQKQAEVYMRKIMAGFTVYADKDKFIEAAAGEDKLFVQLLEANYISDIWAQGVGLMPIYRDMEIKREQNRIKSLSFSDDSKIKGDALKRLGGAWAKFRRGYSGLIWADNSPSCVAALLLPDCDVVEEERAHPDDKKSEQVSYYHGHFINSSKKLYTPTKSISKVLGAKGITVIHMKRVLEAMNAISKVDLDFDFKPPTLALATQLITNSQSERFTNAYAAAILGALMTTATVQDRIKVFLERGASLPLATALNIPKPYTKQLVDSDLKVIRKVKLSEVKDEDEVLLSTLSVTSQFYSTCKTHTCEVNVVPPGKYGVKNGNKLVEVKDCTTVQAKLLRDVVQAMVASRAKDAVGAKDSSSSSDSDEEGQHLATF
jgi:hypothetical protein